MRLFTTRAIDNASEERHVLRHLAQVELDAAKNRLATAQQHLMATQELYQQVSQSLINQQGKQGKIQADVARLGQTKAISIQASSSRCSSSSR